MKSVFRLWASDSTGSSSQTNLHKMGNEGTEPSRCPDYYLLLTESGKGSGNLSGAWGLQVWADRAGSLGRPRSLQFTKQSLEKRAQHREAPGGPRESTPSLRMSPLLISAWLWSYYPWLGREMPGSSRSRPRRSPTVHIPTRKSEQPCNTT